MNAKEFFKKYEIEEISKKTKISPISLRYIKNKEFDKIPRVKFLGFIKIIEKEFKTDLSDLIQEYNDFFKVSKENKYTQEIIKEEENNTYFLFFLAFILLSIGGFLLYKTYSKNNSSLKDKIIKHNLNKQENNSSFSFTKKSFEINDTNKSEISIYKQETNISKTIRKSKSYPKEVIIIPNEKVWFKALNIDTNQSTEKLTSHEQILKGSNWYIKFGHGNITISYGNKTLFPDTKKIIRVLLKDGNITIMKKPNRFER